MLGAEPAFNCTFLRPLCTFSRLSPPLRTDRDQHAQKVRGGGVVESGGGAVCVARAGERRGEPQKVQRTTPHHNTPVHHDSWIGGSQGSILRAVSFFLMEETKGANRCTQDQVQVRRGARRCGGAEMFYLSTGVGVPWLHLNYSCTFGPGSFQRSAMKTKVSFY